MRALRRRPDARRLWAPALAVALALAAALVGVQGDREDGGRSLATLAVTGVAAAEARGPDSGPAEGSLVDPAVRYRIARRGLARVLVELRLPGGAHVAEHALAPAAIAAQRADVAASQARVAARLLRAAHRVAHRYQSVPYIALEVGDAALRELEAASIDVARVRVDELRAPVLATSVPLIEGDRAWAAGYDGTGTTVAIVDSGVDRTHPFFSGRVVEEACYSSTVDWHSTSLCPNGLGSQTGAGAGVSCTGLSGCFHGTHVAGIAAGNGPAAGVSFSGVARGASIMAVQVFSRFTNPDDCGGPTPCLLAYNSDIIAGLERVYALRGTRTFAAVNLSLGGGQWSTACDDDPTKAIIDNLRAARIATVAAAGNGGSTSSIISPACISSAVAVGSTKDSDVVSSFSNAGNLLALFAPGESITSAMPGGSYGTVSGTSMATPHVTGAFAVLRQAAPTKTVTELLTALQSTGLPIADSRPGGTVTRPRVRVFAALSTLVPAAEIVIDNGTSGTSSTGSWCVSASPGPYGPNSLFSCGSGSGDTYRWTPTIPKAATYDVYVWWTNHVNRSSSVPITVVHGGGSTTRNFDERSGGSTWVLHGRYAFNAGTSGYVQTSGVNGQAAADAMRWVPVPPDTTPPNTTLTGGPTGTISTGSATFTWTGTDAVTPASSLVFATRLEPLEAGFSAFGAATTRAFSGLGNGTYTFSVKARDLAGNEDGTAATRTFTVSLTGAVADIIVDNGTAGTSSTGTWCPSAATGPYGSSSVFSCGSGVDTYRWTPTIPATGTYDVYVWWTNHVNRSSSVPITVVHAAGPTTRSYDERSGGSRWVLHGRYSFNAGTAGYVQTTDVNGQAAADAVRWVPVP